MLFSKSHIISSNKRGDFSVLRRSDTDEMLHFNEAEYG